MRLSRHLKTNKTLVGVYVLLMSLVLLGHRFTLFWTSRNAML